MTSMKKPNLIIYVHGWNSHAKARKAELLISELKDNNDYEVLSVTLKSLLNSLNSKL